MLLDRLSGLGIKGTVLKWVKSYLSGRSSRVCIKGSMSVSREMNYGVPQGSIVGPSTFTIYTIPIGRIIQNFRLSFHTYADDIQIYTDFNPRDPSSITLALDQLSACITAIKTWMAQNMLKLNDGKTEFTVITTSYHRRFLPPIVLPIGNKLITPSDSVRIFDSQMTMTKHIKALCTSLNFQLQNITECS